MELYLKASDKAKPFYEKHSFAYSGDSGLDLFFIEDIIIPARQTVLVDLQVAVELRTLSKNILIGTNKLFINKSILLMPRSSIYKTPLRLANSVGLIDSCYRGNIKAPLDNISETDYTIKKGTKLVQLVAPNLENFNLVLTSELSKTDRNELGFGSSGK